MLYTNTFYYSVNGDFQNTTQTATIQIQNRKIELKIYFSCEIHLILGFL